MKTNIECSTDLERTYVQTLASWYGYCFTTLDRVVLQMDYHVEHMEWYLQNNSLFQKLIFTEYQMANKSIFLQDIIDEIDNIKIEIIQTENENKFENTNDDLQSYGLMVEYIMTDNVLMECEKVLYEYENNIHSINNINNIILQLKQMDQKGKNTVKQNFGFLNNMMVNGSNSNDNKGTW